MQNPQILDGRHVAALKQDDLAKEISKLRNQYPETSPPCLVVVMVGNNPASQVYVGHKQKACAKVGITSRLISFDDSVQEHILLQILDELNENPEIHGILLQLPLPQHIRVEKLLSCINPNKDVDGFHPYNVGNLVLKRPSLRPCTPYGIMQLLEHYHIELMGKKAVMVGASNIVGRPMALELLLAGTTVTICHSKTLNLQQEVAQADLLVVAIGSPHAIPSSWLPEGCIVVDVGIHRLEQGRLIGDVAIDSLSQHGPSWFTPVPGGVGPMTVTALLQNTIMAWRQHEF